jgi:hypothetical protein
MCLLFAQIDCKASAPAPQSGGVFSKRRNTLQCIENAAVPAREAVAHINEGAHPVENEDEIFREAVELLRRKDSRKLRKGGATSAQGQPWYVDVFRSELGALQKARIFRQVVDESTCEMQEAAATVREITGQAEMRPLRTTHKAGEFGEFGGAENGRPHSLNTAADKLASEALQQKGKTPSPSNKALGPKKRKKEERRKMKQML